MHQDHNAPPFNPLPKVVVALSLMILAVELMLSAASAGFMGGRSGVSSLRTEVLTDYAFFGDLFDQMLATGQFPPQHMLRFVTYPFVHSSFIGMLFPLVMVLALGKMVGEIFAAWAVLAVFFGASVFGALVYALVLNDPYPLFGAYTGAFGLIGAYTYLLWIGLGAQGLNQLQAFSLIGVLMGLRLVFGLLFGTSGDWLAEISGFVAGGALAILVSPGGWARFLARLRQR